jgi:hypothetical protein
MSQTTYDLQAPVAFPGLLADNSANEKNTISRALEDATSLAPGKPVVAGTDPDTQCELPSAASQVFLGVSVHHHASQDVEDNGYAEGEAVEILTQGRIWVTAALAVAPGDDVYYQHTAGTYPAGSWSNVSDSANADLVAAAAWRSTTAGAGLAILEVNNP